MCGAHSNGAWSSRALSCLFISDLLQSKCVCHKNRKLVCGPQTFICVRGCPVSVSVPLQMVPQITHDHSCWQTTAPLMPIPLLLEKLYRRCCHDLYILEKVAKKANFEIMCSSIHLSFIPWYDSVKKKTAKVSKSPLGAPAARTLTERFPSITVHAGNIQKYTVCSVSELGAFS